MHILILVFLAAGFFSSPCRAYLDGGTSSMLLQLIFGGVAGGMVFIKIYWKKILSFFSKK